MTVMVFLSISV